MSKRFWNNHIKFNIRVPIKLETPAIFSTRFYLRKSWEEPLERGRSSRITKSFDETEKRNSNYWINRRLNRKSPNCTREDDSVSDLSIHSYSIFLHSRKHLSQVERVNKIVTYPICTTLALSNLPTVPHNPLRI